MDSLNRRKNNNAMTLDKKKYNEKQPIIIYTYIWNIISVNTYTTEDEKNERTYRDCPPQYETPSNRIASWDPGSGFRFEKTSLQVDYLCRLDKITIEKRVSHFVALVIVIGSRPSEHSIV